MVNKKLFDIEWANMSDMTKFEVYNAAYNEGFIDSDDAIYSMDDIDEALDGYTPSDILDMMFYGNFNPRDEYFKFDVYGNLESIRSCDIGNYCDYYSDEIYEYLESGNYYGEFYELEDVLESLHAFADEDEEEDEE